MTTCKDYEQTAELQGSSQADDASSINGVLLALSLSQLAGIHPKISSVQNKSCTALLYYKLLYEAT